MPQNGAILLDADLPMPGTGFVVGHMEDPYLLEGWGERVLRYPERVPVRLIEAYATFRLRMRSDLRELRMLFIPPVSYLGCAYQAEVLMEGAVIGKISAGVENWVLRRFELSSVEDGKVAEFAIRTETVMIPAKSIPGNPFLTGQGCFVGAVMLGRKE